MSYIRMDAACFYNIEDSRINLPVVYFFSQFFKCFRDRARCGVEDYPRSVPRLIVTLDDILPTR